MSEFLAQCSAVLPLLAAAAAFRKGRQTARGIAASGAFASFVCAAALAGMEHDRLTSVPMALFAGLAFLTIVAAPKRDAGGKQLAGILTVLSGTCIAYAAGTLPVFAAGWAVTIVPFLLDWFDGCLSNSTKVALAVGLASVAAAAAAAEAGAPAWACFLLIVLAGLLRKGVFPFHFWVANAFENGPVLPLGLLLNSHLGALLLARFGLTMFPEQSREALGPISAVALITAIYTALLGVSEKSTRRVLALLAVSQSSFILAGLESRNSEGITGAAVHWLVVTTAVSALGIAYRLAEVRCPDAALPAGYLGLAGRMPRLAAFFAICGLALVGLPGTLGFVAEDLLFHGAIESHPLLGLALPVATALNAITFLRLFARLFLGRRAASVPDVPDARPVERWALTACVALLVLGGLFPRIAVSARNEAASAIAAALGGESPSH